MTFTRLPDFVNLIARIDSAVGQADARGKDELRELMPELRRAIHEANAALREVDKLLFEGLRDEAVNLYEDEFAAVVARLNLEDREEWPEIERFFLESGIDHPPKIDFDTLSALESAYSEIEELRRPLDRLRRMALERAPVTKRLAILRGLCRVDPSKPTWAKAVADHEAVRLAELEHEFRSAAARRDPEAIAAVHAEVTDGAWSIRVSRKLVAATQGADHWALLRASTTKAEEIAQRLEDARQDLEQGSRSLELKQTWRQLKNDYQQAIATSAECRRLLQECPVAAGLSEEERLGPRLDALAERVEPLWDRLAVLDAADAAAARMTELCGRLELLCDPAAGHVTDADWLAEAHELRGEAERLCETHPGLIYPLDLRERVTEVIAAGVARLKWRRRALVGLALISLAAIVFLSFAGPGWLAGSRDGEDQLVPPPNGMRDFLQADSQIHAFQGE